MPPGECVSNHRSSRQGRISKYTQWKKSVQHTALWVIRLQSTAHPVMWLENDRLHLPSRRTETSSYIHKGLLPYSTHSDTLSYLGVKYSFLPGWVLFFLHALPCCIVGKNCDYRIKMGEPLSQLKDSGCTSSSTHKALRCSCKWEFPLVWVSYPLCSDDSLSLWLYRLQRMRQGAVYYQQGNQLILR